MSVTASFISSLEFERFRSAVATAIQQQQLHKAVLSKYTGAQALVRIVIKPVLLKQQPCLSFVYSYKTNDVTRNFTPEEAQAELLSLLETSFRNAHIFTDNAEIQLSISKKGKCLLHHKAATSAVTTPQQHNREKQRFLSLERPFLQKLGVTDNQKQLIPAMSRKWKQINKFIEIFSGALKETGLDKKPDLHVADFGSGKAYLTFAVHDYLTDVLGLNAQVTGVELRQALVDLCNNTARELALEGIGFEQGDVKHFQQRGINIMIALHACDTATDYAIHMGIRTGADIIMCSPCCHKQIRPQMQLPQVLAPMLTHGIHLGQEAEMVTDSLRAMLLEAHGYDTRVFEFISLEHTSKNKMILATRRRHPSDKQAMMKQIMEIKAFYGIKEHCLEQLLQESSD
ncbi:SAM-dependent methyltransferase [Chromatiaceae bacterium AAb-1]|nr:SAM-dependent methyltransferase [Chromatiaceae bacterium AAb-1]